LTIQLLNRDETEDEPLDAEALAHKKWLLAFASKLAPAAIESAVDSEAAKLTTRVMASEQVPMEM
jgi:hypothetical protein